MPKIKWTFNLLVDFFAEKGHKLLSKEYKGSKIKYDYECKCGNSECSITIAHLKAGHNSCKPCRLRLWKATNLKTFGNEYPLQNINVKNKFKATCIERFGSEHPFQNTNVKEKIKATNIKNLGCSYPMQNTIIQQKSEATNVKNYGYAYPLQNTEIFERQQKAAFKRKPYRFVSGKEIEIQGCEAFALDLLLTQGVNEEDLLLGFSTMPRIMYEHNEKSHRYYPDIFIPSQKKIVEVKSEYTYDVAHLV